MPIREQAHFSALGQRQTDFTAGAIRGDACVPERIFII